MKLLFEIPSVWIGLIGWAATLLLINTASRLTTLDRRLTCVSSWMLWMILAFGTLVSRGLISMEAAAAYVGGTTGGLVLLITIRALITTRIRP